MEVARMIGASPIAAVVTNPRAPDNPIIACNDAFLALTGYERDECIGRNCRFLAGDAAPTAATGALCAAIAEMRPVLVEVPNFKKDGTPFRNAVMVAPVFDDEGRLQYYLGSQMDVGATADGAGRARLLAQAHLDKLTNRQKEVLQHMAAGKMNKQIAFDLRLSERTIKMHRAELVRMLGVRTSAEAIRLAIEAGL